MDRKTTDRFDPSRDVQRRQPRRGRRRAQGRHNALRLALLEG